MSKSKESESKKFVTDLGEHLSNNKFKQALDLFEDHIYDDIIKDSSWDIVPFICSHLTAENAMHNTELLECCEAILNAIAEKCNPSETVLELLEQVEYCEDDLKFCVILKPLGKTLDKMPDKVKAIEWCVSTIRSYIEGLPVPGKEKVDQAKEEENKDTSQTLHRIQNVYNAILSFLEPLVKEAALEHTGPESINTMRKYLTSILIYLLGKPLCYLKEDSKTPNFIQALSEKIISFIACVTGDLLQFLSIIRKRSKKVARKKRFNEDEENHNLEIVLFESTENMPQLAYANFYFSLLTTMSLRKKVPHVYDLQYIFESCLYLINSLLQDAEIVTVTKGLDFCDHLLQTVERRCFTTELLEVGIYLDVIDTLIKVMVYCHNMKLRTRALQIFKQYIEMFNMEARYLIISRLYQTSEHSGLLSLVTGLLKASIVECLKATPQLSYFLGSNLKSLLRLACKLPHGSASDLVELSDEIITSLNLLRFLFIRDKDNDTGIWNMVEELEINYLKPLREGIDLCKAHWRVKIKDLEEQKRTSIKTEKNIELGENDAEVTLIVGGEKLPSMPVDQKITFCHQAFNGLDVMESLLIRINECITNNPLK